MRKFYNIIIKLYTLWLWKSSFYNRKNKIIVDNQKGLIQLISKNIDTHQDIIWIHISSLGEFEQSKTIISSYRKKYPHDKILLTVYSPSAYEIIYDNKLTDWTFYLPHDTTRNAKEFLEIVNPKKVIFIKYEFWFNYINEIYKKKIPLFFVSCVFREEQYFFKQYGSWFANELKKVSRFFVQDKKSKLLLNKINIKNVTISGDTRFDVIKQNTSLKYDDKIINEFTKNNKVLVLGSTYKEDEALFKKLYEKINYKFIIIPHEINNINRCKKIKNSLFLSEARKTNLDVNAFKILIIDEIGILSRLYRYGNIAYVGGGFNLGVHNVIEPIAYKIPVIFGPHHYKSIEAEELVDIGISRVIYKEKDIITAINYYEKNDRSDLITKYLNTKIGATDMIIKNI